MSDTDKKSFWSTLPGVITAIAALITAIGGILLTLHQIGTVHNPQFYCETMSSSAFLKT
jgi:hypothetical protein